VDVVILYGAGERAFCSGGDIAQVTGAGKLGDFAMARDFWRDEYRSMRRLRPIDFARFRWVTRLREVLHLQMEVLHGGFWGWVCRAV
jgi:1,4-dihydroxy-2-naphthoyl-CoA synthase